MIAYQARRGRIHLRVLAYIPARYERTDLLKVVLQVMEAGRPIAEDPIHTEWMTALDLAVALSISRAEGWDITPCNLPHYTHHTEAA